VLHSQASIARCLYTHTGRAALLSISLLMRIMDGSKCDGVFAGGKTICRAEQTQRRPTEWRSERRSSCELALKAAELVSSTRDCTAAHARVDMQHCSVAKVVPHRVEMMPRLQVQCCRSYIEWNLLYNLMELCVSVAEAALCICVLCKVLLRIRLLCSVDEWTSYDPTSMCLQTGNVNLAEQTVSCHRLV